MAFVKATKKILEPTPDGGVHLVCELEDDSTPEKRRVDIYLSVDDVTALPAGAAARRNAIVALIRPLLKQQYQKWMADIAARPTVQDLSNDPPITNLGRC